MTTLRRERRQKFMDVLFASDIYKLAENWHSEYCQYPIAEIVHPFIEAMLDAAESRTEKLTPAELAQVDKKVDAIIGAAREAQNRIDSGTGWRGRELLPPDYLIYGDWWHGKTGLHMYGAKAKAKADSGWLKAFKELFENEVTIQSCNEALESNKWRNVSNPLQIVNDAKAVQAAPKSVQSPHRSERLEREL